MQSPNLKLFLFSSDPHLAQLAERAEVDSIIVDWENQGKYARQTGYDTQINRQTVEDLDRIVNKVKIPVTVRVNGGEAGLAETEVAIDHGAGVIMLPMARTAWEVEAFLQCVDGRAKTLIQIETQSMVDGVADLRDLDWDYAFVGFNDLMISRGGDWLWEPMLDGTMDSIFQKLPGRQIGFGGVTVIGGGYPLPFLNLLREFARLGCSLSFLRRTFCREMVGRDLPSEIAAVRAVWKAASLRSPESVRQDHCEFRNLLEQLRPSRVPARLAS